MFNVHFGCGGNRLEDWENHDNDIDIRNPLPFQDNSVDNIFHEHLIEHVTHQEAYKFLQECFRILKPGGAMRVVFPNAVQIYLTADQKYDEFLEFHNLGSPLFNIIFNHGHQSAWSKDLMAAFLSSIGFKTRNTELYKSEHQAFNGIDGHHKAIGDHANNIESSAIEGIKA